MGFSVAQEWVKTGAIIVIMLLIIYSAYCTYVIKKTLVIKPRDGFAPGLVNDGAFGRSKVELINDRSNAGRVANAINTATWVPLSGVDAFTPDSFLNMEPPVFYDPGNLGAVSQIQRRAVKQPVEGLSPSRGGNFSEADILDAVNN